MKSQNITLADEIDDIFQPRKKANFNKIGNKRKCRYRFLTVYATAAVIMPSCLFLAYVKVSSNTLAIRSIIELLKSKSLLIQIFFY